MGVSEVPLGRLICYSIVMCTFKPAVKGVKVQTIL